MPLIKSAVKAATYIRLGGTGQGFSYAPGHDVIYQSPWWDDPSSVIGKDMTESKALSFVPFFAGVRLLAETVGRMPMKLYRKEADERVEADDKILYGLLHDEPNPAMSAMTFRSALHGHVITRGNGYAERVRDDLGRDAEIWPLRPDRMQVLLDETTGRKFYRYRIEKLGDIVDLSADRVFHVPGFGYNGFVGYSLISLFREALALGLTAQEFGARFFKSGARPAGIITHPRGLSDAALDRFIGTFQGRNVGLSNAQRIALIEEGFTWQDVGMSLDDSQFMETRKFQTGEVATMLGIPPHLIGDVSRSTSWGTGIEEQTLVFISLGALGAAFDIWEQETNRQLVRPAYGRSHYAEFIVDKLLRGRAEDRARFYQSLWGMGVINADTIAKKENLKAPEDGSGATYYRPANYIATHRKEEEAKPQAQMLAEVTEAIGALVRAGFEPSAVLAALNQPAIPHTGLEPVTVSEQTANGNGRPVVVR